MNNHEPPDDWIDALLTPRPISPAAELREQLRRQTTGIVRRQCWRGHLRRAAALAACFLAGLGTASWHMHPPAPPVSVGVAPHETAPEVRTSVLPSPPPEMPPIKPAESYRQASNRSAVEGDWRGVFAASRDALDAGLDEIADTDNFVLLALKADRDKENRHASPKR